LKPLTDYHRRWPEAQRVAITMPISDNCCRQFDWLNLSIPRILQASSRLARLHAELVLQ